MFWRRILLSNLLLSFIFTSEMFVRYLLNSNATTLTKNIRGCCNKIKGIFSTTGQYLLQFDGGSRGNPGLGGSGAVLYLKSPSGEIKEMWYTTAFLGTSGVTNNVAEYCGLIEGLKQAVQMKVESLEIQGDSLLVINQLRGEYKVKNKKLSVLYATAKELLNQIPFTGFNHIPRELNQRADQLSNAAMDLGEQEAIKPAEFSSHILSTIGESFLAESNLVVNEQPIIDEATVDTIHNSLDHHSSHKIILIIIIKSKSRKHPNPLAVISDRIARDQSNRTLSDEDQDHDCVVDFLSCEIRPDGTHDGEPVSHESSINSAVKDFLSENKFTGKVLHTYTLWNSPQDFPHSSVNYCIVELQQVRRAVKKIETLNAQLAEIALLHTHTQSHAGDVQAVVTDDKKKARSRRRPLPTSPNSILRMGVSRLHSVCFLTIERMNCMYCMYVCMYVCMYACRLEYVPYCSTIVSVLNVFFLYFITLYLRMMYVCI